MKFQRNISRVGPLAAVIVLALTVSSANAQAIRPGGAAQVGRADQPASLTVPTSGPWPERFASFFHWLYQAVGRAW